MGTKTYYKTTVIVAVDENKKRSPNMGTKTPSIFTTFPLDVGNKKRSPNMGTKTAPRVDEWGNPIHIKKDPQTWGRKPLSLDLFPFVCCIKKNPQTWGRKHQCRRHPCYYTKQIKKDPQTWGRVVKELRAAVRRSSSA